MAGASEPIRVLLASQRPLVRAGLRRLLEDAPDIEVVGEVCQSGELEQLAADPCPQVMLLDMHLLDGPVAQRISSVRRQCPETAVLALLTRERGVELATLVAAGVMGFVLEDSEPEIVREALRQAARGHAVFSREQLDQVRWWETKVGERWKSLTPRERQVLLMIAEGKDNRGIAVTLNLSEHTVETHVSHLLEKLGLANRTEAAVWVWRHGVRE